MTVLILALAGIASIFSWSFWSVVMFRCIVAIVLGGFSSLDYFLCVEFAPLFDGGRSLKLIKYSFIWQRGMNVTMMHFPLWKTSPSALRKREQTSAESKQLGFFEALREICH